MIKQTKNEEILANKINLCLKSSWIESFKLKLIPNTLNQWNGFYKIEWFDWCIRDINKLSTWEKNIIAFLYFIFKLESPENTTKNKIIIFDDPMNSNDDTMQYLIISKIQELYTNNSLLKDNDKFLLLTHNIHFYLNVRPYYNSFDDDRIKKYNNKINKHNESIENEEDKLKEDLTYYEKNGYYKLNLNWNCSEIMRIKNKDDDYKSNYHALWDDLIYLYENNRTSSMINNCRRILETYINFHNLNSQDFYKNNKEAQKLFNVNSHFIDDFEIDFNSNSREQIIALLKWVFKNNEWDKHFDRYFKINSNPESADFNNN